MWDLDIPIVRTVVDLSIRPGRVCLDYVQGCRKRYANPLKFCFLSAALFAAVVTIGQIDFSEGIERLTGMRAASGPDQGEAPQARRAALRQASKRTVQRNINYVVFFALPITALLLAAAFPGRGYNVAEHYTFVLFTWGQMFLLRTVAAPLGLYARPETWVVMMLVSPLYFTWAARSFYRAPVVTGFLRMLVTFVLTEVGAMIIALGLLLVQHAIVAVGP